MDRKNGRNMAGPYNFRPSAARRMFSSMFHPPSVHTHAPYRFSPLSRPQFVCINAQPRDRSTPPGNEEAEKPGKFRSAGKRCVPRRKGAKGVAREFSRHRYLDACISFPFPLVFMDGTTVPQRREGEIRGRGMDFQLAEKSYRGGTARALLIFLRGRYSSAPLEEALKRAVDSFLLLVPHSPSPIGGGTTISVARP